MFDEKVLEATGLIEVGYNDEGIPMYLGTDLQWSRATKLQMEVGNLIDNEIEELIEEEYAE